MSWGVERSRLFDVFCGASVLEVVFVSILVLYDFWCSLQIFPDIFFSYGFVGRTCILALT